MKKGSRKCLYTIRGLGVERVTIPRSPRLLVGDGGRGGRKKNDYKFCRQRFKHFSTNGLEAIRIEKRPCPVIAYYDHYTHKHKRLLRSADSDCGELLLSALAIWACYLIVGVGTNIARKAQGTYLVHFREIFQTE